jgi:hypothetical protein
LDQAFELATLIGRHALHQLPHALHLSLHSLQQII